MNDLPVAVTEIVAEAAEKAGESLLDSAWPWLSEHWWLPVSLVVLRLSQPLLWSLSQKTKTRVDDSVVRALAWLLGAVERRREDDSGE